MSYYDGARVGYLNNTTYCLEVKSSGANIAHIEFEGKLVKDKTADIAAVDAYGSAVGELTVKADGISRWNGTAKFIRFWGSSSNAGYYISKLRIWYEGSPFTPTPDGGGQQETVDLGGSPANSHYFAKAQTLPKDGKPVRMAFIYHSKFRGEALQNYMLWKTKQGYDVVELCADEIGEATNKSDEALALELRQQLMAMQPRPAYILICGDTDLVPCFGPHVKHYYSHGESNAATDFYYGEFSGDSFAEAYVGRFSADYETHLKAQMDKTQYMAKIDPAEAGWLKHSTAVDGNAGDIDTETPLSFVQAFPKQWPENTVTTVMEASDVNKEIESGCSQITYAGHGGTGSWQNGYTSYNAQQLKNKNKYPVVMSLTCLTGSYQHLCLGEEMMRKADAGAVAFIGGSRETYDHDNFMLVGGNKSKIDYLGYMRSLFHPLEEDESQISRTIGEALNMAHFAVLCSSKEAFCMDTEYYILLGDPTYQPYYTVPNKMAINCASSVTAGHELEVTTAPEAVVCISQGRHIVAVGVADKDGHLTLKLPVDAPVGECVLYASAPFYNDLETTITVDAGDGEEDYTAPAMLPHVEYADVIDLTTAASALGNPSGWPGSQPAAFGVSSSAKYTMWASTNLVEGGKLLAPWLTTEADEARAIYMRNKYEYCSFITKQTAGNAAYVSVDWLNPCGQAEVLGVYGKNTAYNNTTDAWDGNKGTKLGEIRKGQNDCLVIAGNWPYILVRAEDYEPTATEQNDVFIKSLTIGWNKLTAEQPIRELVVSDFGSTTLALEEPYTMPDGLKGQVVSARECSSTPGSYELTLTTKYQSGDVVPAGECLVVKGEPGTYEVYAGQTSAKPSTYPVNLLRADYRPSGSKYLTDFYNYASAYERYYYYKLTTKGGQNFGWYYGAEDGAPFLMSSAERAYLVLDRQLAADVRGFSLEDCTEDMTTGVNVLNSGLLPSGNGVRYDLYGRRALDNRGGIVIENGRKVLK